MCTYLQVANFAFFAELRVDAAQLAVYLQHQILGVGAIGELVRFTVGDALGDDAVFQLADELDVVVQLVVWRNQEHDQAQIWHVFDVIFKRFAQIGRAVEKFSIANLRCRQGQSIAPTGLDQVLDQTIDLASVRSSEDIATVFFGEVNNEPLKIFWKLNRQNVSSVSPAAVLQRLRLLITTDQPWLV